MTISNIQDLFELELQHAYDCEHRLVEALPKMAHAAYSTELKQAFEQHLVQTRQHSQRLEQVFAALGHKATAKSNDIASELVKTGEKLIKSTELCPLRDAALIAAGNQVEHYEIALYGSLCTFAELLGHTESAQALRQTLDEEKSADARLTAIGEAAVNNAALEWGRLHA